MNNKQVLESMLKQLDVFNKSIDELTDSATTFNSKVSDAQDAIEDLKKIAGQIDGTSAASIVSEISILPLHAYVEIKPIDKGIIESLRERVAGVLSTLEDEVNKA